MCPTHQQDPICPICDNAVAAGVPVFFDHGQMCHLDCYIAPEQTATLVRGFLVSRPSKNFCYTCLAKQVKRDRQEVEKAVTALRAARSVVAEPAVCSICEQPRVTAQAT